MLEKAKNQSAYLKAGILGFAASGKSFTATSIAIGLHQYIKSEKPVAFLDTETGSDFLLGRFQEAGIALLTAKSRAFVDLISTIKEAAQTCDILIIDSISHFWDELVNAYMKKANRTRLRVQDWMPIKQEWKEYTDLFINSKLHIIMCGRAGWVYDFKEDEDGVTEIQKTGTKMKAETDMGFEPSLLIEMERVKNNETASKIGQSLTNRAWIIKDRFNIINGKFFDRPTFDSFLPHIEKLNLGGEHLGVGLGGTSVDLFDAPESRSLIAKRREVACENIANEIVMVLGGGRSAKDQQAKIKLLEETFGTGSWVAITEMHPDRLEAGLAQIKTTYDRMEAAHGDN